MRTLAHAIAILLCLPVFAAAGQSSSTTSEKQVVDTLTALVEAQRNFDVGRMDQLLAADYVEISPAGEVDLREAVLGFYAPDKKAAARGVRDSTLDEVRTRFYDNVSVTIARLTFHVAGASGETVTRAFRSTFVTRQVAGRWHVVSCQHTPIRTR